VESAEKIKIFISQVRGKDKEDEIDLTPLALPEELKTISYKTVVEGIIRPRLNELFQMISSEIKKSNLAGLTPAGLVICGGGALTVGLVDSAKRILSMPVRIGVPSGLSGLIDEIESPAFAASVGLLKYSLDNVEEASSGNFLDKIPLTGFMGKVGNALKSLLP